MRFMQQPHCSPPPSHGALQAMADLDWAPEFSLVEGLTDSYQKDFGRGTFRKEADFATDDMVLEKTKSKEPALA